MRERTFVGVISDTHGEWGAMKRAVRAMGEVECIFHLGDFYSDSVQLQKLVSCPVYGVRGNCDWNSDAPDDWTVEVGGLRFYLIHGHQMGVRQSTDRLFAFGKKHGYDVVLYGHTHWPEVDKQGDVLVMNPGSLARPRSFLHRTFGLIEIAEGRAIPTLHRCDV